MVSVSPDGEVEWETPRRVVVRGSYDTSFSVRSTGALDDQGRATELYVSGNPSKFLQGHNVFGSKDALTLLRYSVARIADILGVDLTAAVDRCSVGDFPPIRIDITESFRFSDSRQVESVLSVLSTHARSYRRGKGSTEGSTLYFGKRSRRWKCKLYNKALELKAHPIHDDLKRFDIEDQAQGLLRAEIELHRKELADRGITEMRQLYDESILNTLWREYFAKVEVPMQAEIQSEQITHLPRAIKCTYLQWKNGIDVRPTMSKTAFYRHRSELLGYGIDISLPPKQGGDVIPLFRTVVGEVAQIPSGWVEAGLIHDPRRALHAC